MNLRSLVDKVRLYGFRKCTYYTILDFQKYLKQLLWQTYSQNGEDLVMEKLLKNKKRGFYVDVGANDPSRFSNTKHFYQKGWRGINIEPNSILFEKFVLKRPRDINLNIGISKKKGKLSFYKFFPDTLSTFSKPQSLKNIKEKYKLIGVTSVKTNPLSLVFNKYVKKKRVDFMSIDTEGYDDIVLSSMNWKLYHPTLICIESNKGKVYTNTKSILEKQGYSLFIDNGTNSIYIYTVTRKDD